MCLPVYTTILPSRRASLCVYLCVLHVHTSLARVFFILMCLCVYGSACVCMCPDTFTLDVHKRSEFVSKHVCLGVYLYVYALHLVTRYVYQRVCMFRSCVCM